MFGAEELTVSGPVNQSPELEQVVLDGGAGEHEPMTSTKSVHCSGDLGCGIFDNVSFIKDDVVPDPVEIYSNKFKIQSTYPCRLNSWIIFDTSW